MGIRAIGICKGRRWSVVLGVVVLAGCTTLRPIEYSDPPALANRLSDGMKVFVSTTDGEREKLRVTAIGSDYFEGTTPNGQTVRVAIDEIRRIDRRAFAPGKTAALGAGLAMVYVFAVVGVAVHAIVTAP
jgi:hypothetical protein